MLCDITNGWLSQNCGAINKWAHVIRSKVKEVTVTIWGQFTVQNQLTFPEIKMLAMTLWFILSHDFYCLVQVARSATLRSPLSADQLFAGSDWPLRVSLGFRSSSSDGTVLRSSHQVMTRRNPKGYVRLTGEEQKQPSWVELHDLRSPAGPLLCPQLPAVPGRRLCRGEKWQLHLEDRRKVQRWKVAPPVCSPGPCWVGRVGFKPSKTCSVWLNKSLNMVNVSAVS